MEITIDNETLKVPNHVAVILDGNGRWAKKRGLPRTAGHVEGAKKVEDLCENAKELGIKYVTVYAFSTENWKRSEDEVAAIMKLLRAYLKKCEKMAKEHHMRIRVIGERSRLDEDIKKEIAHVEEFSKEYDEINFTIALNYGSRDEILRAVKEISMECATGSSEVCSITEDTISKHLDTRDLPDPDLMIRTSGEQRLSNFLLWQLGYAEFYFTDVLWPDFNKEELMNAIRYYNGRDRRYGGVKE